jgi:hypothetical protein
MASLTPNVKNTLSPRSILPKLHVDTGAYVFRGQFKFTTTETNGKLCVQYPPMGDEPQELLAGTDSRFFVLSQPYVFDFQMEAYGS